MNVPQKITGGCNCGSIRYTITFPPDTEWPHSSNGTCQCTLCRKFTGCLVNQSIGVPTSSIEPAFESWPSYKIWKSPLRGSRGFCIECGSSMTFQYENEPHVTDVGLGTIDEEVLLGAKTGEEEYLGESGTKSLRDGKGCGVLLSRTDRCGHIWMENAIEGVTDGYPGLKYWRDRVSGIGWEKEDDLRKNSLSNGK